MNKREKKILKAYRNGLLTQKETIRLLQKSVYLKQIQNG